MDWIALGRELQAISQAGLHFSTDRYDLERYERIGRMAAEVLGARSDTPVETISSWNRQEFGYPTPKVDVRGVVVRDNQVLLMSEAADGGRWTLPGGWADVNETPAQAVAREVREETGFNCRVVTLLGVLDREKQGHIPSFPYHVYKLFFQCEVISGSPTTSLESAAVSYFDVDQLPELSIARVRPEQIRRLVKKVQAGDRTAEFD